MGAAEEQADLARALGEAAPEARLRAARRLLELADESLPFLVLYAPIEPIRARLEVEPDAEVRDALALALLARAWKLKPLTAMVGFLRRGAAAERPGDVRGRARAAALACARSFQDLEGSAPHVVPVVVDALGDGDPGERKPAMMALRRLREHGADVRAAAPALIACLSEHDKDVVAFALRALLSMAESGPVEAARAAIEARLDHEDKWVRYSAAQVLAASHGARGRAEAIAELLAHASPNVREGAMSIVAGLILDPRLAPALVPGVAGRLGDPAGGVAHAAAKALRAAAERGIDLAAAAGALEAARDGGPYETEGWTSGPLDMTALSDLRGEWLGADARRALVAHYLRTGDLDALERVVDAVPEGKVRARWPPRETALEAVAEAAGLDRHAAHRERLRAILDAAAAEVDPGGGGTRDP